MRARLQFTSRDIKSKNDISNVWKMTNFVKTENNYKLRVTSPPKKT